jgi:hypothetical protein
LLGDFGAAALLGSLDAAQARAVQRLEVRAFGCLLGELRTHCDTQMPWTDAWLALEGACLQPEVSARPDFMDISAALVSIGGTE